MSSPIGYVNVKAGLVVELADQYISRRAERLERDRLAFVESKRGKKPGLFGGTISESRAIAMWNECDGSLMSPAWRSDFTGSAWRDKIISLQNAAIFAEDEGIESVLVEAELLDMMNRGC